MSARDLAALPPSDPEPYRGYRLVRVYRHTTTELRAAVIDFWFRHRALGEPCLAERRSHELVYLALGEAGHIGGLTTASLGRRLADGRAVFNLRVFIAPADRGGYLMRELIDRTRNLLRGERAGTPAGGVCLVAENPKLTRPGIRRYLLRQGFEARGCNRAGLEQWFAPFGGPNR
jgi:hypothetical protein